MSKKKPVYPITIIYNDGEVEVIKFEGELCCGLVEFITLDPSDPKVVLDANGNKVNLVIKDRRTITCDFLG